MGEPLVKFDVHFQPPIQGLTFAVDRFASGLDDFSELWAEYDALFRAAMQKQFASEGSWGAGGWDELSPAYALWKEWAFPGRPIGVLHGYLRSSMTGGEGYEARITKKSVVLGMDDSTEAARYGAYFAERRPVIAFPSSESRRWQKKTHEWVFWKAELAFRGIPGGSPL